LNLLVRSGVRPLITRRPLATHRQHQHDHGQT
jgi:hypothetical protein